MAENIDGDAAGKIEIARAVRRRQPGAFSLLESKIDSRIGRQEVRQGEVRSRGVKMKCAAPQDGTLYILGARTALSTQCGERVGGNRTRNRHELWMQWLGVLRGIPVI
jgi:hypothetical protein